MVAAVIIQMHDPLPPEHNDLAVKWEDGTCYGDAVWHGKSAFVGKVFVTLHHIGLKLPLFIPDTDLYGDHVSFPRMLAYHVNCPVLKIHLSHLCFVNPIIEHLFCFAKR